ncbi:hypothetical protein GCM10009734_96810 [Nonomuraea bangladeshensis]
MPPWAGQDEEAVASPSQASVASAMRTDTAVHHHAPSPKARTPASSALASPLSMGDPRNTATPRNGRVRPSSVPPQCPPPSRVSRWVPYQRLTGKSARIRDVCCCDAYEFACEGGHYLILRRNGLGHLEETGRGRYAQARKIWDQLLIEHAQNCEQGNVRGARRS